MARIGKEPERATAFSEGILALPTVGMRLAPQVLVLELMREIAFPSAGGATNKNDAKAMPLDPALPESPLTSAPNEAKAALLALRGRTKQRKGQSSFYAPAYPRLAAHGWLRRKSDRVIRDFFIRGALACGVTGDENLRRSVAEATVNAIYGQQATQKDVLELCANRIEQACEQADANTAKANMLGIFDEYGSARWGLPERDDLSQKIATDWLYLCLLEPSLPRLAWIDLVGTFLRTVIPLWLLAQMRLCVFVRDFIRDVASGQSRHPNEVQEMISNRHEALLVPSTTLTDSLDEAVVEYMRARVELNVFLRELPEVLPHRKKELEDPLSITTAVGRLSLDKLAEFVLEVENAGGLMQRVLTKSEAYPAWIAPLKDGQGKNIEEFLRVMRNDHVGGQDDGYLLARGPSNRRLFRVFPAPKVLALMVLLTHAGKVLQKGHGQRLLLSDLERSFQSLGVDFTLLGGVRAELLRALADAGVLGSTPDAGEGATLSNPFSAALEKLKVAH